MNIIGKPEVTAQQMAAYLIGKNPNAEPWALEYAKLYLEEGAAEDVRGDGAWIQSCKETGNFQFTGGTAVTFEQNNFCGLGVIKKGMKGHSFPTPRLGIRAQIQHLKGYATSSPLKNTCIDPRYQYINPKGEAPQFEDLAGKWAVPGYDTKKASSIEDAMKKGIGYGFDIIAGIQQMKAIKTADTESNRTPQEGGNKMSYTNSPLISYKKISPNKNHPRNHAIDTISIHCMAGNLSVESCANVFQNASKKASSNYGIGSDGRIGLYVEEKDRSWCTSNAANDNRAVTIEVANDGGAESGWHVSDKAMASLINLLADICKRNGIKKLVWGTNKADRVGHKNGCNMTVHRDYAAKACPGDYLYGKHGCIADEVNKRLSGAANTATAAADNVAVSKPNAATSTPKYTYQGLDYSLVFDPAYYTDKYADLKKAFGNSSSALFRHFCNYGMKEGRVACKTFDVIKYKEYYEDLQRAFGNNLPMYYKHYITHGHKEKRKCV